MTALLERIARARAAGDLGALVAEVPYARFLGLRCEHEDGELITTMAAGDHLIGNPALPALHGGALGALLESAAAFALIWSAETALLPRIEIREPRGVIGKTTEQAMLVGAVHGYRGLIRELIVRLKAELGVKKLPVVATGGYARLIAARLPEISAVVPNLTLEGLRLSFELSRRIP